MKRRTKTRLLPMDALQSRPCEVDGRPALFHRWVEEDKALLRINCYTTPEEQQKLVYKFRQGGLIDPGCSTEVLRETFALVEYRDGTVAKVKPELVRFVPED